MLWGALDVTAAQGQTPGYTSSQIVSGGSSAAVASGVGVRRATLNIDRVLSDAGADPAVMHFDVLNTTSGSPDDTWITADYTTCENAFHTFFSAVSTKVPTGHKLSFVSWHRVGTGVSKPNPAERVWTDPSPITGSGGTSVIPQAACSITFRTGVRKSWGRTYLPVNDTFFLNMRPTNANVDLVAGAANTLLTTLATADMHLVVVSKPLASSLNVEQIEVDNVGDVIRRRRWKKQTYRKILP
jgi:hypothetical protein